jgi:hypothetical protein
MSVSQLDNHHRIYSSQSHSWLFVTKSAWLKALFLPTLILDNLKNLVSPSFEKHARGNPLSNQVLQATRHQFKFFRTEKQCWKTDSSRTLTPSSCKITNTIRRALFRWRTMPTSRSEHVAFRFQWGTSDIETQAHQYHQGKPEFIPLCLIYLTID